MITFNFQKFLLDKRLTVPELSQMIGYKYVSVAVMVKRGSVKLSFVRDLEKIFGDCSAYIIVNKEAGRKEA